MCWLKALSSSVRWHVILWLLLPAFRGFLRKWEMFPASNCLFTSFNLFPIQLLLDEHLWPLHFWGLQQSGAEAHPSAPDSGEPPQHLHLCESTAELALSVAAWFMCDRLWVTVNISSCQFAFPPWPSKSKLHKRSWIQFCLLINEMSDKLRYLNHKSWKLNINVMQFFSVICELIILHQNIFMDVYRSIKSKS